MDDLVPFGSRTYNLMLLVLLFARGMDFLSTWIATPNMVLEGNPIARRLGWRWGIPVNLILCFGFAAWPFPAIVVSTTSGLVAARNFQAAWLMRSMGEEAYREWHRQRIRETPASLFLTCLVGQTFLIGLLGGVVVYFASGEAQPVLLAIGFGMIGYAVAVIVYTGIGIWRLRHFGFRATASPGRFLVPRKKVNGKLMDICPGNDIPAPGS